MFDSTASYLNFWFIFSGELVQIMMATANENLSAKFCNRVLKFFTKLFQLSKFIEIRILECNEYIYTVLWCGAQQEQNVLSTEKCWFYSCNRNVHRTSSDAF